MNFSADVFSSAFLLVLGTSVGSLLALVQRFRLLSLHEGLSFAGGVMLVASFTSLILPSLRIGSFTQTAFGIILGFSLMGLLERLLAHEHVFIGKEGTFEVLHKRVTLIMLGVIIHNMPEGFSVGVSSAYDLQKGLSTALAIAIQDIPEGLVVSLPLMAIHRSSYFALLLGVISGVLEGLFCVLGYLIFTEAVSLLPLGLALGGGAMLYVVAKEVFPEVYSGEKHFRITVALLAGLLVMLYLDTLFS
ncbi:ZIP family metal transporter [Thermocrinis minervae]|uniref:Zinc transporter, ZIP family n=1 Tax=Thermocrinis minervae TaxID=381751 RepID=A0A1M6SRC4_9AQUI|nr:ZIP family metal transporter [Thermocrinis minervae]SHK47245.1 zinc transporter, ZIP family [Thermocrinis minervae]